MQRQFKSPQSKNCTVCKDEPPLTWDDDYDSVYTHVKSLVHENLCIAFYNPAQPAELEVDASQKGLKAALIQHGKPEAFASKNLTPAQAGYSNTERDTGYLAWNYSFPHMLVWSIILCHVWSQALSESCEWEKACINTTPDTAKPNEGTRVQFQGPLQAMMMMMMMMISKFNGTSTPNGSYSAKTGVNCNISLNRVQCEWYRSLTAHQHQEGQTVPKQV